MSDQDEPPVATTASPTMAVEPQQHAYALESESAAVEDYPPTGTTPADDSRAGRIRWTLSVAALLAAVAALIVAGVHGVQVLAAPNPAPPPTIPAAPPVASLAALLPSIDLRNQAFLGDLRNAGVPVDNPSNAISNAYVTCVALRASDAKQDVAVTLMLPLTNAAIPKDSAEEILRKFTEITEAHYCPGGHL